MDERKKNKWTSICRPEVTSRMSGAAQLSVPLVVDSGVGDNWDEAH
jgi:DNA polymerase I-like protein with 3'-5' exonuclease and polymerase domains